MAVTNMMAVTNTMAVTIMVHKAASIDVCASHSSLALSPCRLELNGVRRPYPLP